MVTNTVTRVAPLEPPYPPEAAEQLEHMMPPGVPPIALFRTFVRNLPMTRAMHGWGTYELSRALSISMRHREVVIDRTCARCGCEYEWGVHISYFASRVGLDDDQIRSLTHGSSSDPCWADEREVQLIRVVDALHDTADLPDSLWQSLASAFTVEEVLDIVLLAGWYHAISFAARALRVPLEAGAPRFANYALPLGDGTPLP
jgi:alkylhydroperoxidase family enzyme